MTLVLETGSGIIGANAYVTEAFVTTYLTGQNRQAENSWSSATSAVKAGAIVAATQYIDSRWGARFKGSKEVYYDGAKAQGILAFSGQPSADDTVTIGSETYTFKASLSTLGSGEVVIGASTDETVTNLIAAVNANSSTDKGVLYSSSMIGNMHVTAALVDGSTTEILLTARQEGESGNDIALTESSAQITVDTAFTNGRDEGSQPLEFPRIGLFDRSGRRVTGIPRKLKEATAEYAVRAVSSSLFRDPTIDASGRAVKREKIGPIETEYADGSAISQLIKPYPAADKLLAEYTKPVGVVR